MTVDMFNNRAFTDLGLPHIKVLPSFPLPINYFNIIFQMAAAISMGMTFLTDALIVASMMYYLRPRMNPFIRPVTGWFDRLVTFTIIRLNGAT
jgi:hypothetical protein